MGISPDRMIYANPVKTPKGLAAARLAGVYKFTYDSESEIYKMAEHVPGSTVLLRVRINNSDAMIDLNKKFGANPEEAIHLLRLARDNGLNVAGLCFHVGSGSLSVKSYINALVTCRHIFDEAKCHGFDMKYLDIGGGFTSLLNDQEVDIANILSTLNVALAGYFPGVEIWSEPGRFICSTAMNLITSVIGVTVRDNNKWYFLDEGLYGTFSGIAFDHWEPELITFKDIEKIPITFAGPSCDSMDILMRDKLVEPLNIGETILVPNCGAYSVVTATNFNGFEKAKIIIHK
jgi:ornithine decarboxylase